MDKKTRIIVMICLVLVIAFLVILSLIRHPYTAAVLLGSPEEVIADAEEVSAQEITITASQGFGNEMVFVYELDGTAKAAAAQAWFFGGRYSLECVALVNVGEGDQLTEYDPSQPVTFRLSSNTDTTLFAYKDGGFSLISQERQLNENFKETLIRIAAAVVILVAVLFLGKKKPGDKKA